MRTMSYQSAAPIWVIAFLLITTSGFSQNFSRQYGNAFDNAFSKVLKSGANYFVVGRDQASAGALSQATVTRLNANGVLQWTRRLDIASVWNDAILTSNGSLLLVGHTLPADATNKSIIGLITAAGVFTYVNTYDAPGRESLLRIVRNPVPQSASFPYYVVGLQAQAGAATVDDVILINMSETAGFNWKKLYSSSANDQFYRDFEALSNGDLLLSGAYGNSVIFRADNVGNMIGGATTGSLGTFNDVYPRSTGGGFYAVGSGGVAPNIQVYLVKFDNDLINLWETRISGLTAVSQVWEDAPNGWIYVVGTGIFNGKSRAIVIRLIETGDEATQEWARFLDKGETSYNGGSAWRLSNTQMAFVDGRIPITGGFGQLCAFMSVSDLEMATCMTIEGGVGTDKIPLIFDGPVGPNISFYDTPPAAAVANTGITWQQADVCSSAPCVAAFTSAAVGACGNFQFTNQSSGPIPPPLTYAWNFGDPNSGANNTSTATNPTHQFNKCGTYNVCLTVTGAGCTASVCHPVVVTDNVLPTAVCKPGVGVTLNANCSYTVTTGFVDGGSSDNCPNWSLSVSPTTLTGCDNHTVTLTVTDWCGNTKTCTMGIQTTEGTPPTITCPVNKTVDCDASIDPANTGQPTAFDACGIKSTTYVSKVTIISPCKSVIDRLWTVTDNCNNTATCVQQITVMDMKPPTIMCPPNSTVNTLPGLCYYAGTLAPPTGTDNCDPSLEFVCSFVTPTGSILITPQTQFPKGVNNITCFSKDDCGNQSANCNYTLTVADNQPPTITCPQSLTVNGTFTPPPTQCKAVVNGIGTTVTDNCPNWTLAYAITGATTGSGVGDASATMFMQGTSTVTYTVTDCGMSTKTCSFTVVVICQQPSDFPGFKCGQAVISCFSGFLPSTATPDPNGPVLALVDLRQHALAQLGTNWWNSPPSIYHKSTWTAANMGQIFGVTIDGNYNVYASSTTMYGRYSPRPNADYGNVYKIDATTGAVTVFATLPQNLSSPAGLGDVWYDAPNNQLFVSNFFDGKVYRITGLNNPTGTVAGISYDFPGTAIGTPSAGFVARGERVWALATYNNRLYFSVWNEDRVNQNSGGFNEIWSVGLSGGVPTGSAVLEHKMSSLTTTILENYSSPVSDIHFSKTGNMLVAERSIYGDVGNSYTAWSNNAHRGRIIELSPSGSWTSERIFHVGNAYNTGSTASYHANSSGGTDYGYESFNPAAMPKPTKCDSMVWGTGDALRFPGYNANGPADGSSLSCGGGFGDYVYGIAGMRWTGNSVQPSSPNFVKKTSIYIDVDNNICSSEKTQLGDVDVFDCGCLGGGPSLCDSISITSMPFNGPQDTCCFKLTLKNDKPNYFTAIQLCAQNGVSISTVSTLNGCVLQGANASMVTIAPTGGIGNYFPVVSAKDFVKFCLSNYQITPTQQIIIKYFGPNFKEVCRDTLIYHCTQKPKCLKITPTVICGPPGSGTYTMNFCIMSDPLIAFNVNSIVLNAPPGVTFTPNTFSVVPPLTPGGMQCGFTTTISGPNAVDGATFCFSLTGKSGPLGTSDLDCCTDTVMLACVTLPTCVCNKVSASATSVTVPGKKCCWQVTLTNNYSNSFFSGVQLCSLTPGVVFGCINNNSLPPVWILSSSSTVATLTKFPLGSTLGQTEVLPAFCLSGLTTTTQLVEIKWLDKNGKVVCRDTLTFHCDPPEETDCAVLVNPLIVCDLNSPGGYTFSFQVYNNTGANGGTAFNINQVQLTNITGGTMSPAVFPISPAISYTQTSGVLTTSINGPQPGQQICFTLTVHEIGPNGNQLNCCTHSQTYCFTMPDWPVDCQCGPDPFSLLYSVGHGPLLIKHCGDVLTVPDNPNLPIQFISSFQCIGLNCPPATVTYTLMGPPGFTQIGPITVNATPGFSTGITNSTFTLSGTYMLNMIGHCGQKECPCKLTFIVPQKDSCCMNYDLFCQNVMNATSVTVDHAKCKATLNIGNLPACDKVQGVNWGDGTNTPGPFAAGAMPMHTYAGGGTYVISYLALEYDNSVPPKICFEKILKDTIALDCPCDNNLPAAGLTGYFPFVGNAADLSSTSINGTVNGATLTTGHDNAVGSAYLFGGNSNSIDCGTNNRGVTNAVSVCAWVRTSELTNGQWIAGKYDGLTGMTDHGYILAIGNLIGGNIGQVTFDGRDGNSIYHTSGFSAKKVNDDKWHCVVGTAGNNQWAVYVDGSNPVNGNVMPGSSANLLTSNPFTIGKQSDSALPPLWMNGSIDNVLVYNRVLTPQEIECFCKGAIPSACECGTASLLSFGGFGTSLPATCGNTTPVVLPCLPAGDKFYFHGNVSCAGGADCLRDTFDWNIKDPSGKLAATGGGPLSAIFTGGNTGHFDITGLDPTLYTPGTVYTLTFNWFCGGKPCTCAVKFVVQECPGCKCGKFANMFLRPTPGAPSIAVDCGNTPPLVPCPPIGQSFHFSGQFACQGTNCPATAPVDWMLIDPMNNVVATGTITATPGVTFNLNFSSALFSKAGVYCLKLTGHCGSMLCPCLIKFRFEVPCPNDECVCGTYSGMFLRSGQGPSIPVVCFGNAVPVNCPPNGQNLVLTGQFQCQGSACPKTILMDWVLYSPANVPITTIATVLTNPNFSIPVPSSLLTQAGTYTLKMVGHCGANDCPCEIKFIMDPPCPNQCECGQFTDLFWRPAQGAPSQQVKCGDVLTVGCNPNFNPILSGNFMCLGANCPPNPPIQWELRGLPLNNLVASGNLSGPGFSLALLASYFTTAGMFELTFTGACGGQSCPPCKFKITATGCCCQNYDLFCQNVMNATSVTVDHGKCKATLNIGNLPDCDYIDKVNWGDGSPIQDGPFASGAMPMHNYAASGIYTVCFLAIERDGNGLICFEKSICDTVAVDCTKCPCIGFDKQSTGAWTVEHGTIGINSPGSSNLPSDFFLQANDAAGASWITNETDYSGNWNQYLGKCFCWDFKVINDGDPGTIGVHPWIMIYQGSPSAPTLAARFNATITVDETTGWAHVCAPIDGCIAGSLPSNLNGSWTMTTGANTCANWLALLNNVSGVQFFLDLTSSPTEVYGFDNICIKTCQECSCRSDLTLTSGNQNFPVFCNPHTGFIPLLGCQVQAVSVNGFFGCFNTVTGGLCPPTNVWWTLDRPGGLIDLFGTTTNFPALTFPGPDVSQPGEYCLRLYTICPGETDTCICTACWVQDSCPPPSTCCKDYNDFCQRVMNAVQISTDPLLCKVTLNIGSFGNCDDEIEWVQWDANQPPVLGPFLPGSTPMHFYPGSGTHIICYRAVERRPDGTICFEKVICDTIKLDCSNCPCAPFDEPSGTGNWFVQNGNFSLSTPGPSNLPGDAYLQTTDGQGPTWLINSVDYSGNWGQQYLGKCICWDYRIFDDSSPGTLVTNPQIWIFGPGISAKFIATNVSVSENSGWVHVCAPIGPCVGGNLPSNAMGSWQWVTGGTGTICNPNWNTLLSNITSIRFPVDYTSAQTEVLGFDNICIEPCDGCNCLGFEDMSFIAPNGDFLLINCNDTIKLPCADTLPGNFVFHGDLLCSKWHCGETVDWTISPLGGAPIFSGTQPVYGNGGGSNHFDLPTLSYGNFPPGTYQISLTGHCGGSDCKCNVFFTIPNCDCNCAGPSDLSFIAGGDNGGGTFQVMQNNATPVALPCPSANDPTFIFHGDVHCNKFGCMGDNFTWSYVALAPPFNGFSGAPLPLSWTDTKDGHFDLSLPYSFFTPGVPYELTVIYYCGGMPCKFKVKFLIERCPCPCDQLKADVAQGFNVSGGYLGCKRTFKPKALCSNDQVFWTVNGPGMVNVIFGPTTGNAPQMVSFPFPGGWYSVCMQVVRTDPNTGQKCEAKVYQTIKVKCKILPNDPVSNVTHCTKNVGANAIQNGDFIGGTFGQLGQEGNMPDWSLFPNIGDGFVFVNDSTGASDDGHLILTGGKGNFAGVYQKVTLPNAPFTVIEYAVQNPLGANTPANTVIEFRLQGEPIIGGPAPQILYRDILPTTESQWMLRSFSPQINVDPTKQFLVVCLQSDDATTRSVAAIDNIEICSSPTVTTVQPESFGRFRIFPNPNSGAFTVELPQPATPGMAFRVTDLAGRLVLQKQTEAGNQQQTVQADDLPDGLYFLQVVQDGRVLAVEKFAKQH